MSITARRLQRGIPVVNAPSGYPNASNTGVPFGTTLQTGYNQSSSYGVANGTVITGRRINCAGPVEHPMGDAGKTITYRNCSFVDGGVYWLVSNNTGMPRLIFDHCTFVGGGDASLSGDNVTLIACDISGGGDGMKIGSGIVVQDSWFHNLNVQQGSHNDGIQSLGTNGNGAEGSGALIKHNTFDLFGGPTCIMLSTGSASDMRDILIEDNLLSNDLYCIYAGYQQGADVLSRVSNIKCRNNKVKYGSSPNVLTSADPPVVVTGTTWYDGPNAGQPV